MPSTVPSRSWKNWSHAFYKSTNEIETNKSRIKHLYDTDEKYLPAHHHQCHKYQKKMMLDWSFKYIMTDETSIEITNYLFMPLSTQRKLYHQWQKNLKRDQKKGILSVSVQITYPEQGGPSLRFVHFTLPRKSYTRLHFKNTFHLSTKRSGT